MVKVVRTPANARDYFSANALAGWAGGVAPFSPTPRKGKKRRKITDRVHFVDETPPPVEVVSVGKRVPVVSF